MLRLVLLTSGFTLAVIAASLNCVDMEVHSNSSTEVKKFISKEGQLLFFPSQGFDGITINYVIHKQTTLSNISPKDLCVNSSQWYRLKVTVTWESNWYQVCKFHVGTCSGKCGKVRDWVEDDFNSISVVARGASFWSVNNTQQQTQCTSPVSGPNISAVVYNIPTIPDINSYWSGEVLMTWPVGVGGGVVIVTAVVVVLCIVRRESRLRLGRQQRQDDGLSSGSPPSRVEGAVYISTNSLYEPLDAATDTGVVERQRQDDGFSSDSLPLGVEEEVYISTNSLYEPFCAVTDTGVVERQRQDDGFSSDSLPLGVEEEVYINTNSLYEPFCAVTDTGGVSFLATRGQQH